MNLLSEIWSTFFFRRHFSAYLGGILAGLALVLVWWCYQTVPRANLLVVALVACSALALLFQYPILGTCALAFFTTSNITQIVPSGFMLPLMVATSGMAIARRFLEGEPEVRVAPLLVGFLIFATAKIASLLWSPVYDQIDLVTPLRILVAVLTVSMTVRRPQHLTWVIVCAGAGLIFSTTATIQGMLTFFGSGNLVEAAAESGIQKTRFFGYWPDPNAAGMVAVPVLILNLAVMRCKGPVLTRAIAALAVFMGVIAVVLSQSRGAGLSLLVAAVMFIFADKRRWILLGSAVATVLLVIMIAKVDFVGRMASLGEGSRDASLYERSRMAEGAFRMFEEHFPLGVGTGNVITFSADYSSCLLGGLVSHNALLDVLAELGLFGLAAFILALVSVYPALRLSRWTIDVKDMRQTYGIAMVATFLTILVAVAISSCSEYTFYWLILAIISTREWVFDRPEVEPAKLNTGRSEESTETRVG
jgi:O-antigen ligase